MPYVVALCPGRRPRLPRIVGTSYDGSPPCRNRGEGVDENFDVAVMIHVLRLDVGDDQAELELFECPERLVRLQHEQRVCPWWPLVLRSARSPPTMNDGSAPHASEAVDDSAVVVVFPCVPVAPIVGHDAGQRFEQLGRRHTGDARPRCCDQLGIVLGNGRGGHDEFRASTASG